MILFWNCFLFMHPELSEKNTKNRHTWHQFFCDLVGMLKTPTISLGAVEKVLSLQPMGFFKRLRLGHQLADPVGITLQGTITYPPQKWAFWVDDFPNFPFGGICIHSLEGNNMIRNPRWIPGWCVFFRGAQGGSEGRGNHWSWRWRRWGSLRRSRSCGNSPRGPNDFPLSSEEKPGYLLYINPMVV